MREANAVLGADATRYAYTKEGYFKWGHGAYVAKQAMDRDNVDNIYKVLNYFLSGEYRALQARDRGYAGPNMDLGVAYAEENGWSEEEVAALKATEAKVARNSPSLSSRPPRRSTRRISKTSGSVSSTRDRDIGTGGLPERGLANTSARGPACLPWKSPNDDDEH